MMGARTVMQEALFYGFSLEGHMPSTGSHKGGVSISVALR